MTSQEQQQAFAGDLDKLIARYEKEFQLTNADAVGVLMLKVHGLCAVAFENDDDAE
jgi:hypothetical protein